MKSSTALLIFAAVALGAEAAACRGQARFDKVMCKSHMCTDCV
eukprot:CAMPEP_0171089384 /NCGR_PEP_ID=MMETSP0766_2-20121228/24592_1 /TAXON_ID=439317 /ORGANISM="Gambierdiscus australes, Strain CAWD 149" /LENGTH=42 /DNA_ID= /DNA_START= /DNA_END= /DNA_ORIENTATION=